MDVHIREIDGENINTELNELELSDSSTESINQNITEIMYDYLFNVIIVGDSGVGKTDLIGKFCDDDFKTKFLQTLGINVESHCIDVDDKKIKLQIWDPSGSERYMHLTAKYFRNANGVIFMYDVTYPNSFSNIKKWIDLVDKNTDKDIPRILVGNKCDINRRLVTKEQGEKLAESSKMTFIETSAFSGLNVTKVFFSLSKTMKTLHEDVQQKSQQQSNQCQSNNTKENENELPK